MSRWLHAHALLLIAALVAQPGSAFAQGILQGRAEHDAGEDPALAGFDLKLEVWETTGIVTAEEAYENQLTLVLEPTFSIGARLFKGTWAEPLILNGRLLLSNELAGNDPTFRSSRFASPASLGDAASSPASGDVPRTQPGLLRESNASDFWIGAFHGELATIPGLDAKLQVGTRVVFPTSFASRSAGLYAAPSLYAGLDRTIGPVDVGYGVRGLKYFHATKVVPIRQTAGTVDVNGQQVEPEHFASSGTVNPDFAFMQLLTVDVKLPADLSLSLLYALTDTWARSLEACTVQGVVGADVCTDGALLGDVRRPGVREDGWFLAEIDWAPNPWLTVGLGVSTAQSTRRPDGAVANPFIRVNRDNLSTIYLSIGTSAEAIAQSVQRK